MRGLRGTRGEGVPVMFMVRDKPRWASTTRRTSQVIVFMPFAALFGLRHASTYTLPLPSPHPLRRSSSITRRCAYADAIAIVLPVRVNREPRVTHNAQPTCDRVYPRNKPRQSPISFIETTPQRAPHAAEHSRRQAQAFGLLSIDSSLIRSSLRAGRQTAALSICA